MTEIPTSDIDLYSDRVIQDPFPVYEDLRNLGPIVCLPTHGNYAFTRLKIVRDALRNPKNFASGSGVAADDFGCSFLRGNTVASDPPRHTKLRAAIQPPLLPAALEIVRPRVATLADDLINHLVKQGSFDAMPDLAHHLPLTIVRELVGLPEFGKEKMLTWAGAAFDALGVQNQRGCGAIEHIKEMRAYIDQAVQPEAVAPGSFIARVLDLKEKGEIEPDLAGFVIRDYINPSLDTTISAIGQLILQLGRNPEQWQLLKSRPDRIPVAVHEAVRLGTPIRSFSRHTSRELDVEGHVLPAGARIMMLFASANRDEEVFDNPDQFDVTRNNRLHVGFGAGIHTCVGMHLAIMEMTALLEAMVERVDKISVGEPTIAMNNTIHSFSNLPTEFTA
ncbi:MAG: cytochrome P450 [Pseudomonadota bacterium]